MDEFEIVDKNSLEIDINEHNLNISCNIANNDFSPDKYQDFSIISEEMKNEDVKNIANIVESDCTSPLSIENVDLNSESAENINHDSIKYESYPLTMLSSPLSTLDANKQNIDNCAEILIENLDKVNLLNVNEEKENKREDSFTGNVQRNEETDSIKINYESLFSMMNIDESAKNNPTKEKNELDKETSKLEEKKELNNSEEPDFRVNIIERNDSEDKWSTNDYIHNDNNEELSDKMGKIEDKNELDREPNKSEKKELNNSDEPDFRVNIIERNDSEDKWSTNAYIHNDNNEKSSDNMSKIEVNKELDRETSKLEDKKELNNSDEPDFRVNIIDRNDSKDKWSTNAYIHNDNNEKSSDNMSKIEVNKELDRETSKTEEKKELNNSDEPDFRVNIIEKNDSEDKWSTNAYIHNDNNEKSSDNMSKIEVNKELDRETSKTEENKKLNNTDEPDFRVNIIERNDSEDKWSTSAYIHNDNKDESSDNMNKTEKNELDKDTSKLEEKKELSNPDEPDFRVNIIERNDSEDKWSTSTFAHGKEISSDTEKVDNRLINSEINSSNSEVIKSDSVESSSKEKFDEREFNNNCSNGNQNGNQQSENEIILSQEKSEENMNIELQKEDISNKKVTQATESVIIRPLGIDDPNTFPGMSALIHMLFNCVEFRKKMIEYHHTDQIAYFDLGSNKDIKSEDLLFINNLCKLFVVMKENNPRKISEVGWLARNYFRDLGFQLNAEKGFEYILEKINSITKTVSNEKNALTKEDDIAFFNYKCLNKSFVNDLLTGQIMNTTFCCKCQKEHEKTFEHIRYLSLKIPKEKNNVNLENCIQNLFNEVKIETSHNYNCCSEPDVKLKRKLTHIPEYLFIYLDRKLENNERDNTFVEIDSGMFLESADGIGVYSLCSVIDEIFVQQTFFNIVKCLSDAWWSIEYMNCRKIAPFEIITGSSIGFMYKKQID